jgi:hypothetical protein
MEIGKREFIDKINTILFPNDEDVEGGAIALMRLQDTYDLDAIDLSNGIIVGNQVAQSMTGG